jgi:hypothetical protein
MSGDLPPVMVSLYGLTEDGGKHQEVAEADGPVAIEVESRIKTIVTRLRAKTASKDQKIAKADRCIPIEVRGFFWRLGHSPTYNHCTCTLLLTKLKQKHNWCDVKENYPAILSLTCPLIVPIPKVRMRHIEMGHMIFSQADAIPQFLPALSFNVHDFVQLFPGPPNSFVHG